MSHKKYILPIFLLYTITSMFFLLFFAISYYKEAKSDIYEKTVKDLRAYANEIEYMLRINGGIGEILDLKSEYEINLYDIRSKRYVLKNFDRPIYNGRYHVDDKFMYYSDDIHTKRRTIELNLELRTQSPHASVDRLFVKISMISIIVLLAISVIAYFIVKLSYLPLLNQIKTLNNFITDTTHEINTPLSVILMSVEMFDKNPSKYLENIKIASKTLSNLYNDLALNLKSEPNKIEKLKLKDIFIERAKIFEMSAANKDVKIILNLEDAEVDSDSFKFKKILDNIISNAIKYSFKSQQVIINLKQDNFCVVNFGSTISKENLNKIYDKFSRFDSQNGGFGIGLSLVKRYCDELGFKVNCVSGDDKTEFCVKFKEV
ncbi:sensor histidine kinase [Campylobacter fetus]|uniref:histidine kinase n=1 Tax=Campylobacter fetus subsp. testudinum TaxID=1507806 RepID=A0AAX0HBT0_CAMFE|nr:HAMP domain-containing sensor histidine kinase [Campylobacter fetus]AGZ81704.1 two-component system sensor histidine kinase [Campylobacter fetus subsp. testudinum 03-427]AJB45442.1 histidine kinase [Campylobacter fetus subsp. testudinum]ALV64861.1 two-component system sensor histidine kinase [Campylobacter fetus subsp. testudinum Sp3]AVK81107.1 sensor histidine kinase [Campylobacter fetus subsp. testudinum]EAI4321318.1 HAMP domain-containing histidine kinase [Campylobacter fetus]